MEKPLTSCSLTGHCLRLQKHPEGAMSGAFPEMGTAKQSREIDDVGVCYDTGAAAWLLLVTWTQCLLCTRQHASIRA